MFSAIVFSAMQAGNANSMAPDYKKAMISASRLYQLLDREPEIDGLSEEGEKPQVMGGPLLIGNCGLVGGGVGWGGGWGIIPYRLEI